MDYTKEEYLKIYELMAYSRYFERTAEEYVMKGIAGGNHHLSTGDEAVNVGIFTELGPNDWIVPQHRSRPMVCKRVGEYPYLCEMLSKRDGFNGGMSGDTHFIVPEKKLGPYSGLLGQAQAIATGIAHAYKMDKIEGCVVIGCGDGTLNEGSISEVLNIISVWKLPVVFYIQNNGYGISTPVKAVTNLRNLSDRGIGFGLPSATYEGIDVFLVKDVMREAIAKARKGEPSVVEFKTTRWAGHFTGDPEVYRDKAEAKIAKANQDALRWCRNTLLAHRVATEAELDAIDKEQNKNLHEAFDRAVAAPLKTREDIVDFDKVYAK